MTKWGCRACGWIGTDPLAAENPFDNQATVCACPHCRSICELFVICEVEGCTQEATCGTPAADGGYVWCCMKHFDEIAGASKEEA